MNRRLLLGLLVVIVIMGIVGLSNVSSTSLFAPPPPPPATRTPDSSSLQRSYEGAFDSGPMPTEKPKSREEQEAIDRLQQDQLEQSQALENEQDWIIPTRIGQPPKNELASYKDPNFGFSFTYPSNWEVVEPDKKAYDKIPDYGYAVTIVNFNHVNVTRDSNPDEMKIDIWLFPKPEDYSTLEAWAATQILFAPETTYTEFERFSVGKKQFITWTATGPTVRQGARLYALERPNSIFYIVGYPSTSLYISSLDELVKSIE